MDALSTAADVLSDHPVVRVGFAAAVALGLMMTPFEAMVADPIDEEAEHVRDYNDPCTSGCDTYNEICCNDPIG